MEMAYRERGRLRFAELQKILVSGFDFERGVQVGESPVTQ